LSKLSKWDSDILNLKPRDLALCRLVYALQIEHRFHNTPKLEQMAKQVIKEWHLSDVLADGIRFSPDAGFFKLRQSSKLVTVSSDLVRVKRKNGILHRRIHYRKGWNNTRVVSQKIVDADFQGKE
jgi:hypothetical protein